MEGKNRREAVDRAIFFDLNGTLLDDFAYNIEAFQAVFSGLGLEIPAERIEALMGKPTSLIIREIAGERGIEADWMDLARRKVDHYLRITRGKDLLFPDARETLAFLRARVRLGLFTGVTRKQVDALGEFLDLFEVVVAGEEAVRPKPAPDTLLLMAEGMGFDPGACAYVGDMPQDMILARNAGMLGIGFEGGSFSAEALREAGAEIVIRRLAELKDLRL